MITGRCRKLRGKNWGLNSQMTTQMALHKGDNITGRWCGVVVGVRRRNWRPNANMPVRHGREPFQHRPRKSYSTQFHGEIHQKLIKKLKTGEMVTYRH